MNKSSKVTCAKVYPDLPFAHRQHRHDGHCAMIHGHNWAFKLTFAANHLDANMFVVDFGKLKWIRRWLEEQFDHTLVLNSDDPWLPHLQFHLVDATDTINPENKACAHLAKIVVVPNCGAEGLGVWILEQLNARLSELIPPADVSAHMWSDWRHRRLRIVGVEVFEDSKNTATITSDVP